MTLKRCTTLLVLFAIMMLTSILSVDAQASTLHVSIQQFEKGLMLWRGDNSTIYVLGSKGNVFIFPSSVYSTLSDNPIFGDSPGRLRPILGFGRVWGHYAAVRDLIGWPTLDEIGFDTTLLVQNKTLFITELNGSVIQINPTRTWQRNNVNTPVKTPAPGPTACPYPIFFGASDEGVCAGQSISVQAAYQTFQEGYMIWLANTGDIWVFYRHGSRWEHFTQAMYEGFADADPEQPPSGTLIQPLRGFGRVWHNLRAVDGSSVRSTLGWATSQEIGYTATTQFWGLTSHTHTYITMPDERIIDAYSGLAGLQWSWVYRK